MLTQSPLTAYQYNCMIDKNHVATPRYVVEDIYNLIDIQQFHSIWFPFNNYDSQFKLKADELKLTYKATHIFDDCRNDFFKTNPPKGCDLMISNPPFNIQNAIIQRSFDLHDEGLIKSFCLLLPLSTLETPARSRLYEILDEEIAVPDGFNDIDPQPCYKVRCYPGQGFRTDIGLIRKSLVTEKGHLYKIVDIPEKYVRPQYVQCSIFDYL